VKRIIVAAAIVAVVLGLVVGVRRWIHHAQLELVPVITAPGADPQAVVAPPPRAVASRMLLDVRETLSPPSRERLAVLTFDDGPYPVETPALLAELASLDVPADFFLIGNDTRRQPAIAKAVAAGGDEVGNHSLTHPEMSELTLGAQRTEIADGAAVIDAVTGDRPAFFRPPHGNYDEDTIRAASAVGESVALWDEDTGDWRDLTARQITQATIDQARAPAVILLHDGKDATIDALPQIVATYRRAGYRFVTLRELERDMPLDEINDPVRVTI